MARRRRKAAPTTPDHIVQVCFTEESWAVLVTGDGFKVFCNDDLITDRAEAEEIAAHLTKEFPEATVVVYSKKPIYPTPEVDMAVCYPDLGKDRVTKENTLMWCPCCGEIREFVKSGDWFACPCCGLTERDFHVKTINRTWRMESIKPPSVKRRRRRKEEIPEEEPDDDI